MFAIVACVGLKRAHTHTHTSKVQLGKRLMSNVKVNHKVNLVNLVEARDREGTHQCKWLMCGSSLFLLPKLNILVGNVVHHNLDGPTHGSWRRIPALCREACMHAQRTVRVGMIQHNCIIFPAYAAHALLLVGLQRVCVRTMREATQSNYSSVSARWNNNKMSIT